MQINTFDNRYRINYKNIKLEPAMIKCTVHIWWRKFNVLRPILFCTLIANR